MCIRDRFQYNGTYFTTYKESGTRRLTLAERLRKLPLSFFGKRDLADLTSTIMADCEVLEKDCSHFIPGLFGSLISTVLIALSLFAFNGRMALAALWVIPVSAAIVVGSYRVQDLSLIHIWCPICKSCSSRSMVCRSIAISRNIVWNRRR